MGYWPHTPPAQSGPSYNSVGLLINWADYTSPAVNPPAANAALGVTMQLRGQGAGTPISRIEAVYIDNSFNSLPVYVVFPDTGYMILVEPYAVQMRPVLSLALTADIYCEGFDGEISPSTRVVFLNHYVASFIDTNAPAAAVIGTTFVDGAAINATAVWVANLPTNIQSGDGLAMFVSHDWGPGGAGHTISMPAGWTKQHEYFETFLNSNGGTLFTRTADGNEGATVNITFNGNADGTYTSMRVANKNNGPSLAYVDQNASGSCTVPGLTPNFGAGTVWIAAFMGWSQNPLGSVPGSYTVKSNHNGPAGASTSRIWVSERDAQLNSDAPSPFISAGSNFYGFTTLIAYS